MIAAAPSGTLSRKIHSQPAEETSAPPTIGPSAMDAPKTAPHTPTACARSRGSVKVLVMIDMATGLSIEAPTPCRTRKATSSSTVGAMLQRTEATVKTPRPRTSVRRRPSRSAIDPEKSSRLAITTV